MVVVRERERYDLLLSPLKETRVHIALPRAERRENGDKRCERKERQRRRRRERVNPPSFINIFYTGASPN